jgi:hypothetical protein
MTLKPYESLLRTGAHQARLEPSGYHMHYSRNRTVVAHTNDET